MVTSQIQQAEHVIYVYLLVLLVINWLLTVHLVLMAPIGLILLVLILVLIIILLMPLSVLNVILSVCCVLGCLTTVHSVILPCPLSTTTTNACITAQSASTNPQPHPITHVSAAISHVQHAQVIHLHVLHVTHTISITWIHVIQVVMNLVTLVILLLGHVLAVIFSVLDWLLMLSFRLSFRKRLYSRLLLPKIWIGIVLICLRFRILVLVILSLLLICSHSIIQCLTHGPTKYE